MTEHLRRLKELTESLPGFPKSMKGKGFVRIEGSESSVYGFNLKTDEKVGISEWYAPRESVFPAHRHVEKTWHLVIEGKMELELDGSKHVLEEGDFIYVAPGVGHQAFFPEGDCRFLAISMPSVEEWPS